MPKSVQFALAAGSMLIFASAAMAQDATVGFNPLFEVQPPIAFQIQPQIWPRVSVILRITIDDVAHARYAAHMGHASSCAVHIGGEAPPRPCLQA